MVEIISNLFPNVMAKLLELQNSTFETLYMLFISGTISLVFGLIFGIILVVTKEGNILENKTVYYILDKIVNIFRSIPFIILLAAAIPFTRFIM